MHIRLAKVINAFPACFTTQAKENKRFYAAENTLLHYFHHKTYGMFIINTQYVNYRHQRLFYTAHLNDFAQIQCTPLQLHVTCICLSDIRNVSDTNKVLNKLNYLNMRQITLNIGKIR